MLIYSEKKIDSEKVLHQGLSSKMLTNFQFSNVNYIGDCMSGCGINNRKT